MPTLFIFKTVFCEGLELGKEIGKRIGEEERRTRKKNSGYDGRVL